MQKRKGRLVVNQEVNDVQLSSGESVDAYWRHVELQADVRSSTNKTGETTNANPDSLIDSDENKLWGSGVAPELAGRIIEEFSDGLGNFPVLSKQENQVLRVYLITGDIDEVKRRLKLSRSSINTYMARIRSKLLRLLKSRDF